MEADAVVPPEGKRWFSDGIEGPDARPAAEADEFPAWAPEARNVPPGRIITAQTATTIGSSQIALRPGGDGDIADGDEAGYYRKVPGPNEPPGRGRGDPIRKIFESF